MSLRGWQTDMESPVPQMTNPSLVAVHASEKIIHLNQNDVVRKTAHNNSYQKEFQKAHIPFHLPIPINNSASDEIKSNGSQNQ